MNRLGTLLMDIVAGYRPTEREGLCLMKIRDRSVFDLFAAADELREKVVGNAVTYVKNQNLNCTNICSNQCGFCGFCRKQSDPDAYLLSRAEIRKNAHEALSRGVTEICSVSGLHPDFTLDSYIEIYTAILEAAPGIHLHAGNPMEVAYAAEKSGCSTKEVLSEFKRAGVSTICGTAAEILSDPVRERICPGKISTSEWVRIIKEAHQMGLKTTATIMYGHCESDEDRIHHLSILRDIQDETSGLIGGFYIRDADLITPTKQGGTGTNSDNLRQPHALPERFESGTPNYPGAVSLKAGISFLNEVGFNKISSHMAACMHAFYDPLRESVEVIRYSPTPDIPVFPVNIRGMDSDMAGFILRSSYGIIIRTGLHCAPLIHKRIGCGDGCIRISPSIMTSPDDCRYAGEMISELAEQVKNSDRKK